MNTATTTQTRNSSSTVSVWIKRAAAGALLACVPAMGALAAAPVSLAAPTTQGTGPSVVAHHTPTHVQNGAVKHHHRHRHTNSVRTGGFE